MSTIKISQGKCILCGMCILECPAGIFNKNEHITTVEDAETKCINCGHCMSICPVEAVTLPSAQPGQLVPIDKNLNVSKEHIGQFLKSNRSMRQYKDIEVTKEVIAGIMDITRYAPSARNLEPIHWIITKTRKETAYLADLTAQGIAISDRYAKWRFSYAGK
jgi:ferredoxin